jgi:hypothetical protein
MGVFLVSNRSLERYVTFPYARDQVALGVNPQLLRASNCEADSTRVSAGRNDEVVLELTLGTIINKVDPRINGVLGYFAIVGNVGVPPGRIVA